MGAAGDRAVSAVDILRRGVPVDHDLDPIALTECAQKVNKVPLGNVTR